MDKFLNRKDYINKYKIQKEEKDSKKIFIDQKQRLKKELNSISSFTINSEDIKISRKRMTREETKKKKKIDKILKEFTKIDKNSTYLREDTNLNLLKNMDKVKKYSEFKKKKEKTKFNVGDSTLHLLLKEEKVKKTNEIGLVPTLCKNEKIIIDKQQEINKNKQIEKDIEIKKDTLIDFYLDEKDNNINNDIINNKNDSIDNNIIPSIEKEIIELENQNLNEIKTEMLENNNLLNVSKNFNKTLLFFLILFFILLIILFILLKYANI